MNITVNGVTITLTPEQISKIENGVKENITSAEQKVIEIFEGCTEYKDEKFPDSIFWMNESGDWMFELENSIFWCRYSKGWKIFEEDFRMEYSEIQNMIKKTLEERYKMKTVTPATRLQTWAYGLEERYKMKTVTPRNRSGVFTESVEERYKMKGVTAEN